MKSQAPFDAWNCINNSLCDYQNAEGVFSFVNPYSMMKLKNEREWLSKIDGWHVDGISLVKWFSWIFGKRLKRFSFDDTSLAPIVFDHASKEKWRVVLIGSDEVSIQRSVLKLLDRYSIDIVYYRNGFFSSELDRQACLHSVNAMKPDLVVVGMGTPLQESFLVDLVSIGWKGRGYSCGGYFHQLGGDNRSNYYPNWMNSLHLRWLYRIWDEPKLLSRYFIVYPGYFISSFFNRFFGSTLQS